jgi:group I intron endonuclease
MGYIYLVTNLITKQKYVGQTIREDIETRWKQHRSVMKNALGTYLYNAYKHYGIDNFKFEIICICFDDDCNIYEEHYIKKLNTLAPSGYNLKLGGRNSKHHPDTLAKMSKSLKGKPGNKITDKHKKMMSERMSGAKNPNYGKKISEEQKRKTRETRKERVSKLKDTGAAPDYSKQIKGLEKGRKTMMENGTLCKRIGKFDKKGNLISEYESISAGAKENSLHVSVVSKVCNNAPHCKTAGGFIWRFI